MRPLYRDGLESIRRAAPALPPTSLILSKSLDLWTTASPLQVPSHTRTLTHFTLFLWPTEHKSLLICVLLFVFVCFFRLLLAGIFLNYFFILSTPVLFFVWYFVKAEKGG